MLTHIYKMPTPDDAIQVTYVTLLHRTSKNAPPTCPDSSRVPKIPGSHIQVTGSLQTGSQQREDQTSHGNIPTGLEQARVNAREKNKKRRRVSTPLIQQDTRPPAG